MCDKGNLTQKNLGDKGNEKSREKVFRSTGQSGGRRSNLQSGLETRKEIEMTLHCLRLESKHQRETDPRDTSRRQRDSLETKLNKKEAETRSKNRANRNLIGVKPSQKSPQKEAKKEQSEKTQENSKTKQAAKTHQKMEIAKTQQNQNGNTNALSSRSHFFVKIPQK